MLQFWHLSAIEAVLPPSLLLLSCYASSSFLFFYSLSFLPLIFFFSFLSSFSLVTLAPSTFMLFLPCHFLLFPLFFSSLSLFFPLVPLFSSQLLSLSPLLEVEPPSLKFTNLIQNFWVIFDFEA